MSYSCSQECVLSKALAPQAKREAVKKMVDERQLSERRACSLVGLSRDSYRNPPQPDQFTLDFGERIVDIAHVRRRFGYSRIHDLLCSKFPRVNHKRV
jgi:putative transposase